MYRAEEGGKGEALAKRYLETEEGYKIIGQNLLFPGVGELDLVAADGETLAIIEVRYRSSEAFGHPFDTVDRRKMQKTVKAANAFLASFQGEYRDVRFDLVAVTGDKIELMKDAFYGALLR